ncbi:MAG: imidazole glycerol phosphate synthase subunit HisF [Candidatus Magasanikbacteria bacterium]|nr:imidazole glycerol phosphate synthase subunit HisF [Candidatus Magasanikbacteria bacterium]
MLKVRVIPCLTIKELRLVKSVQFADHRNIGSYIAAVRVFNTRDVDEMIVLDLDGHETGPKPWLLEEITKECFMPLTIGGGIKTLDHISSVLKIGADKISINSAALKDPFFINQAAATFGRQCIVVSIDACRSPAGGYEIFSRTAASPTARSVVVWAREVEARGAGEIMLTSVERDGMMNGYDTDLVRAVTEAVSIPVIASGGAGSVGDFVKVVETSNAAAVAAASVFQYTQVTPMNIKQHLIKSGIPARI